MTLTTRESRRSSARNVAVAAFATVASLTFAEGALAQQIVVEGNRRVDAETVRSYVTGSGSGSVEEARRNLLASGMFSDVRISRRGAQTVVTVRENNTINRVFFEGSGKIPREVLEGEVQAKARGPFTQGMLEADAARIREIYQRTGRGFATVTPRVVDLPNGRVDVVYTIQEGSKTGVREIRFVGNQAISSSRLRGLMTTTEMNFMSWFKTNDIYDPDRIASDQELIRRYYLKNGFADFRILSTDAQFDANAGGYIITINVQEGQQYRVGNVQVESRIPDVSEAELRSQVRTAPGQVYDAEAVEKTLTGMTTEVARRGYAFAQVRPAGQRDPATGTINLAYVMEEGPRVYIERINVRGNSRTRDYVVRREFDVSEGDAYNKVLMDRAERRLNSLGFFKKVRVTNEPGSAPDRVVVNVDVEDQPTGAFSIAGGYSTADGFIGEVSVTESNFLGRGQFVRLAGTWGERSQGVDFSFTEPYLLGYRMAGGIDLFSKYSDQTEYARYENRTTGGQLRLGFPVTDEFGFTLRYSLYQQELKVPNTERRPYNDCSEPLGNTLLNSPGNVPLGTPGDVVNAVNGLPNRTFCEGNGEASLAIKEAAGTTWTSAGGVTLAYSTLDNGKSPRNGLYAELKPDVAGLGGDSKYVRVLGDARYYHEFFEDIVGIARVQGGHIMPHSGDELRVMDHFFLGPTLVRGFAPGGIGPRDVSTLDSRSNAVGGTTYFGGSLEAQFPIWGLPRELGLKGAVFADAGTLFNYEGITAFDLNNNGRFDCPDVSTDAGRRTASLVQPECIKVRDNNVIRSSVGASILWSSPLGPIRFDYAVALSKDEGELVTHADGTTVRVGGDRTQAFRFSGGTRF